MARPFNKLDHVICRMDRQRMLGKSRSGRDVRGQFAHMIELPIRAFSEQRDHHVLQSDHTNAQMHQFGIAQLRHSMYSTEN